MTVTLNDKTCIVERGDDPKCHDDSLFLHRVKKQLIADGHDVIKKRMAKDGHMVSDDIHYIRERKGTWCIWYSSYQIHSPCYDYNRGRVTLTVERAPEKDFHELLTERFKPKA